MTIQVVKLPLAKMTFTPDVPAAALGPNEYNAGKNVETDVRGVRSVAGDESILDYIPGTPTYVTGGYRQGGIWWFVVAVDAVYDNTDPNNPIFVSPGKWYASSATSGWQDITPTVGDFSKYNQATNITESWNGTVLFLNDESNPPMFWPDDQPVGSPPQPLVMYSNQAPVPVGDIQVTSSTWRTAVFTGTNYTSPPFQTGGYVILANTNPQKYNGTYYITSATTSTVSFVSSITTPFAYDGKATAAPQYTWNYNPNWDQVYAKFMRQYNTPNVGSILVAGNLTATPTGSTSTQSYPVTVQWSQSYGLNQAPQTWTPTVVNVANQLEVPLRGEALDAFPCNGLFFLCSYWDTVVFSPLNYSTTAAPILGVRQFNQGRGLLSSNCWANTDKLVYGVDARDIWVFDGSDFQGIGNQRVKNWFYDQLDPKYYNRVFMETNTQKSQIEIFYPDSSATGGTPNKMISYRYDIDCWNAPRDIDSGTFSTEAPVWGNGDFNPGTRCVVYARGCLNQKLVQKDQGFYFVSCDDTQAGTDTILPIDSEFRRDNIKVLPNYTSKLMVHRVLPEVVNLGANLNQSNEIPLYPAPGNITVTIEGANSVGSQASTSTGVTLKVDADGNLGHNPWAQINQNAYRVNTLSLTDSSTSTVWHCSAMTWQVAQVEEDR
jgi:hypothetical protein